MRVLITGGRGFVGTHLKAEFEQNGYDVICSDIVEDDKCVALDILQLDKLLDVLTTYKPKVIVNLAGQANVGLSWEKPQLTVALNTIGLINVLEAVKAVNKEIRIIAVGSSDEYGSLKDKGIDVKEDMIVNPITPYAVSKYSQELFSRLYVQSFDVDVCMIRLFNLGGSGQRKGYIISDFASGIAEIEVGKREFLSVGNLASARDFTHVKDACRAIRFIVEKGHKGEVYNICSGTTHTAKSILDGLIGMARTEIEVRQDPMRIRPSDTPVVCGNHEKLTCHTGWKPEIAVEQILVDALDYWRKQV